MSDVIFAVVTGIISVILFIYVSFTVRCKGPILSNTYLFASEEERNRIDKIDKRQNIIWFRLSSGFWQLLSHS
ncbi:hypothetical protein IMSAGC015_02121 [Lachnospiraceae bacterium]|jgi:nicotinamide riboside transporter PnuC|nr:hypothetical protein IMSAGC015_02121 [Lachnospiraceae bacterium]